LILYNGREVGAYERAESLAGEILEMCIAFGGSITGEHGVGMEKRSYLPRMFEPDDVEAMQSIRRAIDPQEISNPGKMFPGGDAPSLTHAGPHPLEKAGVISRE
jgi:glycolate oxidase